MEEWHYHGANRLVELLLGAVNSGWIAAESALKYDNNQFEDNLINNILMKNKKSSIWANIINKLPKLACTTFIIDEIKENRNEILLESFPKFPLLLI